MAATNIIRGERVRWMERSGPERPEGNMDIGRALTFTFHDPGWVRTFGIAVLLGLTQRAARLAVPGVAPLVELAAAVLLAGFTLHVLRRVAEGSDLPLPSWTDWSRLVVDGSKSLLVTLAWALVPLLLFLPLFGVAVVIVDQVLSPEMDLWTFVAIAIFVFMPLGFILSTILPAAEARLATTGSLREGVRVGAVLGFVRSNPRDYLIFPLVGLAGGGLGLGVAQGLPRALGGDVGLGLSALASAVITTYANFVGAHLSGQAYRRAVEIRRMAAAQPPPIPSHARGRRPRAR